jgi:transmembrane sensor
MNNQTFETLVDKYLKGLLNEQETAYVEKWLDSLEDKEALNTLSATELATAKEVMYRKLDKRINQHRFVNNRWLKVAAAVIFIVSAGYWLSDRNVELESTAGSIRKQILSDGSIVWLKGASRLTYPRTFGDGNREVTLAGEALFEVAQDAKHPFRIYCGDLTTTVLGTSFNIRNTGNETSVSVLTGKISLTAGAAPAITLTANENAVYSATKTTTIVKAATALHELTKGTEYDMAFNDAGMQDVIQRIERKFNVDIQLTDSAIVNNLITADMTDQSLEQTVEMICQALNLEARFKGQTILLQPKV